MSDWQLTTIWYWRLPWYFRTYRGLTKSAPYRVVWIGPLCLQWIDESKRNEYDFDTGRYMLDRPGADDG